MITKDELERLKQPSHKNAEVRYTIGGPIEAAVHSNVESERIGAFQLGHRTMHKAVEEFRNEMMFKTRDGQARAQFLQSNTPPPQGRAAAEDTWRQSHTQAHEDRFKHTSENLKQQTASSFQNETSKTSADTERATQSRERVQDFAAAMKNQQHQSVER